MCQLVNESETKRQGKAEMRTNVGRSVLNFCCESRDSTTSNEFPYCGCAKGSAHITRQYGSGPPTLHTKRCDDSSA